MHKVLALHFGPAQGCNVCSLLICSPRSVVRDTSAIVGSASLLTYNVVSIVAKCIYIEQIFNVLAPVYLSVCMCFCNLEQHYYNSFYTCYVTLFIIVIYIYYLFNNTYGYF